MLNGFVPICLSVTTVISRLFNAVVLLNVRMMANANIRNSSHNSAGILFDFGGLLWAEWNIQPGWRSQTNSRMFGKSDENFFSLLIYKFTSICEIFQKKITTIECVLTGAGKKRLPKSRWHVNFIWVNSPLLYFETFFSSYKNHRTRLMGKNCLQWGSNNVWTLEE